MNRNHGFSLIFVIPVLATLLAVLFLLVGPSISLNTNPQQNDTQIYNLGDTDIYESKYWGFSIAYPKGYFIREYSNGVIIYNFEAPKERYVDKAENKNDVIIRIDVDSSSSSTNSNTLKVVREVKVDGNTYKVTHGTDNLDLWTSIPKNNYKYVYHASVGNENLTYAALGILSTMKFQPIMQHESANVPIPNGYDRYQNTHWGIAFDYPNDASFSGFDTLGQSTLELDNKTIQIMMMPNRGDTKERIDEIKRQITISADGPGTGMYSPPERMRFQDYKNSHGAQGYKVTRYTEEYKDSKKVREYVDEIIVFPLGTQEHLAIAIGAVQALEFDKNEEDLAELIAENFQILSEHD